MRKRRRNITIVNNKIDYDKLAEAIVKANLILAVQEAENKCDYEEQNFLQEKITFKQSLKILWSIITNRVESNGTLTSGVLGYILSCTLNVLSLLSVIFWIFTMVSSYNEIIRLFSQKVDAIIIIFVILFFAILAFLFTTMALMFRAMANEIAREKDRDYTVAVFSGIVSFAALIVALIALLKGVG